MRVVKKPFPPAAKAPFLSISADAAETLALQALAWLVADDELCGVFLGATGASEQDLRTRASDPEFLGSVLDFLLMDDAWIIAFCNAQGLPFDRVQMARAALPGGQQMHWT